MSDNFITPPMPNNEVIETLKGLVFGNFKISTKEREALARAVTIIENIETTRCRDCKYYDGRPCGIVDYYNTESDFCSRAEGRTDE